VYEVVGPFVFDQPLSPLICPLSLPLPLFLTRLTGLLARDFVHAGELFMDSLATFTCVELMAFRDLVLYAVLAALLTLDRPTLKRRIIDSPEVLSTIREIPHLEPLLGSLYECRHVG
jgi:hypothetical protein